MAQNESDKIGTMRVDGNNATIYYKGGSTFTVKFDGIEQEAGQEEMHIRKDTVDKWVAAGTLRLTNAKRYDEITAAIDPLTGDTPTHHADGTIKTLVERELNDLKSNGFVGDEDGDSGKRPQPPRMHDGRKTPKQEASMPNPAASGSQRPAPRPIGISDVTSGSQGFGDGTTYGVAMPQSQNQNVSDVEIQTPQLKPKSTFPKVIVFVAIMLAVAIALLLGMRTLSGNVSGMNNLPSFGDDGKGTQTQTSKDANANANATHTADNTPRDENGGTGTSVVSDGNTITRTDYDPEVSVADMPMADDTKRDIASGMFSQIRMLFSKGDTANFLQIVNLDGIAGDVARSYANSEKTRLSLTDSETQELETFYKQALIQDELEHVSQNDTYGSIFGGRIREVRSDPNGSNTLYVVMESLGGDHQRVCLVLTGNDDGTSWIVSGIKDPDAYVTQVMAGDTSTNIVRSDQE